VSGLPAGESILPQDGVHGGRRGEGTGHHATTEGPREPEKVQLKESRCDGSDPQVPGEKAFHRFTP
jgi:hypothetical protein